MIVVWGWRTVFRLVGSGVFSCPNCGADRNYERRRAQRFFTFFFIPLIPLKVIGEFIRCTYCKTDFRESVLARPTAAQFTDLLQNTVRGVMVNVLRRGGAGHPGATAAAVEEIVTSGAVGYSQADLAQDMGVVPEDLTQLLAALAAQLPEAGREALVRGAVRVAAADGPVDVQERAVIDTVGAALGMTQAHVAGVVASVPPAVPGTGQYGAVQDAVPQFDQNMTRVDAASSMETMVIPPRPSASNPAPAPEASSMETMLLPPQPAAPLPDPAADAGAPTVPTGLAASGLGGSGYQDVPTVAISAPVDPIPAPAPPVAAPVSPIPDPKSDASAMETMVVPLGQVPPQRPHDSADDPTHVTPEPRPQHPGGWQPSQQ